MCCEQAIQNDQMVYTISFLRHVEPNLCPGVRSLHCQLGDKPSVSIDSWLQAMGLRPRDVERAPEVTRALPAGGRLPVHRHAAMPAPRQLAEGSRAASKGVWLVCLSRWMRRCAGSSENLAERRKGVCWVATHCLWQAFYGDWTLAEDALLALAKNIWCFARNSGDEGRCCTAVGQGSCPDFSSRAGWLLAQGLSNGITQWGCYCTPVKWYYSRSSWYNTDVSLPLKCFC